MLAVVVAVVVLDHNDQWRQWVQPHESESAAMDDASTVVPYAPITATRFWISVVYVVDDVPFAVDIAGHPSLSSRTYR